MKRPLDSIGTTLTGREILLQPEAWDGALAAAGGHYRAIRTLAEGRPVLFSGCGTSYYVAIAAARTYQQVTGLPARAVPGSELMLAPEGVVADGTTPLLVAVSRSGETSETVLATRRFRERRLGSVLVLTARAESSLGREGDLTLALPWADDQSVVMTRSFTTLLLAAWSLAAAVAGDRALQSELEQLPSLCGAAIEEAWPLAARLGEAKEWDHFIYLGMGAYGGLALEGMLKLKEMTRVPCEAYAPLEFRHGPISVVTERTTAILLCQEAGAPYHGSLLADIRKEGGRTVAVGHPVDGLPADHLLPLGEGLSDRSRGLLYMPLLQLFALQRALTLGLNPDQPQKLARVVRLDG